jgi:hypothetical protein
MTTKTGSAKSWTVFDRRDDLKKMAYALLARD